MDQDKNSLLLELNSWDEIIHSDNWRVFLKLLKAHQEYLQGQVNEYLSKHEDRKAGECLACLNDSKKIIALVQNRINEIRKSLGGESNG